MDWILGIGGIAFIGLGVISYVKRDWVWRLYGLDPRWRERYPQRTPQWDIQTRRFGFYFIVIGAISFLISFGI